MKFTRSKIIIVNIVFGSLIILILKLCKIILINHDPFKILFNSDSSPYVILGAALSILGLIIRLESYLLANYITIKITDIVLNSTNNIQYEIIITIYNGLESPINFESLFLNGFNSININSKNNLINSSSSNKIHYELTLQDNLDRKINLFGYDKLKITCLNINLNKPYHIKKRIKI
jgi:hypothetical protein